MSTAFANEQLSAYLDGELDATQVAQLEALLQEDPELRSELEALERATDFFRTHAPLKAPDNFVENVLALVEHEPVPANNPAWWRRPFGMPIEGVAVAAAALLVLGVTLNFQSGTDAGQFGSAPRDAAVAQKASPSKDEASAKAVAKADVPVSDAVADAAPKAAVGLEKTATGGLAAEALKLGKEAYGSGDEAMAASDEGTSEDGASDAQPKMRASYSYSVTTDDPDVMAGLLRAAAKHRGKVEDGKGMGVDGEAMDGKEADTFFVHLPASALAQFGDELRTLGKVQQSPSPDWLGSEFARIRVDVKLIGAGSAPSADTTAPPRKKGTPAY